MNLLLLRPGESTDGTSAVIDGERAQFLIAQHGLTAGLSLRAGIIGGSLGHANVELVSPSRVVLRLNLPETPPERLPVILIVGISRPQTVKKVLMTAVTMGVSELHFVRCELAEKSYLSAQILDPKNLDEEIELALSQAVDTIAPAISVHSRFKPFFEDTLPKLLELRGWAEAVKIVADTATAGEEASGIPSINPSTGAVLAVGPEAGWSEFERSLLKERGFTPISLGRRMLRVETAVAALTARLALPVWMGK